MQKQVVAEREERPSTKSFSDLNEIWYVDRDCSCHESSASATALSFHPFTCLGAWPVVI